MSSPGDLVPRDMVEEIEDKEEMAKKRTPVVDMSKVKVVEGKYPLQWVITKSSGNSE